jgi:class 3 adenylate cyclase
MTGKDLQVVFEKIATGIDFAPVAFAILNPDGGIEWGYEGFARLMVKPGDPEPENLLTWGLGDEFASVFGHCLSDRKPAFCTCRIDRPAGNSAWFRLFMVPKTDKQNKVVHITTLIFDITDFRQKEQELSKQNRQMAEITRHIEKTNALLEIQKGEITQQKRTIEEEKEKSDMLLMNILPHEVARQLKSKGRAGTREYKLATVLFTDFKSFSRISKELTPNELVSTLDSYFALFDEITVAHYMEKIKTIGDSYMCAGGLPLSNRSNPVDAVLAGLEIQHCMKSLNESNLASDKSLWELRVGIHTGPVVAGVIGHKRFAYDIWGDTVNIASRMEQNGEAGMVNISGTTYEYIHDYFECDYRGKVETKNIGKIDMYFVRRIKPEFSDDAIGFQPNDRMISIVNKL